MLINLTILKFRTFLHHNTVKNQKTRLRFFPIHVISKGLVSETALFFSDYLECSQFIAIGNWEHGDNIKNDTIFLVHTEYFSAQCFVPSNESIQGNKPWKDTLTFLHPVQLGSGLYLARACLLHSCPQILCIGFCLHDPVYQFFLNPLDVKLTSPF